MSSKTHKLIGQKIGMLTILSKDGLFVNCKCDCGNEKVCRLADLKRGRFLACGCQHNSNKQALSLRAKRLQKEGKLRVGNDVSSDRTPFLYLFKCISNANRKENYLTIADLKEKWMFQRGLCAYSGVSLHLPTHSNKKPVKPFLIASIDRVDPSEPYRKGNFQFVSQTCNYAKHAMSHEEMLEFITLLKSTS